LKIYVLSKRDTSALLNIIHASWPIAVVPRIKSFKVYEIETGKYILRSEDFVAIHAMDKRIVPFLGSADVLQHFPSVTVDMGAVKFVCNGAKIMRPGITKFDRFKREEIVVIKDQGHDKALSVGIALEDSEVASLKTKGYVVSNIHYIGDKFWEAFKELNK
jgi:PUA domain protein